MRIVYFGTPHYAVPALAALANDARFEVALVVTQPDRPAGRGNVVTAPPVKIEAARLGLPIYQPKSLRTAAEREPLVAADADLFVVAAYGLIFGEKTLAIPRIAAVNLHASLLPKYRGASPITAAILEGDAETGVTLMVMERGLDAGPTIATGSMPIPADATTESLTPQLGELGAALLIDKLMEFAGGAIAPAAQPLAGRSQVRTLTKADGEIDWTQSATAIERQVRAMWAWPRAWARIGGQVMQIHRAGVGEGTADPGLIQIDRNRVMVGTGEGTLILELVQFPGRNPLDARALINSGRLAAGDRFSLDVPPRPPLITALDSGSSTSV